MKKGIILFLILVVLLAACSNEEPTTDETATTTETTEEEIVEEYTSSEEAFNDMENRLLNKDEAYTLNYKYYFPYGESDVIAKYDPKTDSFNVTQETTGRDLDEDGEEFNYEKSFEYTIDSNNKITNEEFKYEEDENESGLINSYSDTDKVVEIHLFNYSEIIDYYKYIFEYANDNVIETKFSYKYNFINLEGYESYTEELLEDQIANIEIYKNRQYLNFNYTNFSVKGQGEITFE